MARIELPTTGGFYVSRSRPISNQECVNFYVHVNQGGGLVEESLYGTPGITQLATSGIETEKNRGAHVKEGIPYFVNGTTLYRLNRTVSGAGVETFDVTSLGTVEGEKRVSMADNGTQLCILVPGGKGYIFNEDAGTPFEEITDADFRANGDPQFVVFVDGFFMFTTDTKEFIISAINDGLAYNALDVGTAEADPDKIVALIINDGLPYIAGSETIEPFRNIPAGADFPFLRIDGGLISTGVFAPYSLVNIADTFMFIGGGPNEKPGVYVFQGGQAVKVSTDGIDFILEQFTETQISDAFGWVYSESGAKFVGFSLPTTVIVFDLTSKKWHERKSFAIIDDITSSFRWRANSVVKAYDRILVGDAIDGRIGELDLEIFDEYDNNIVSTFSTIPFSNTGNRLLVPSIELTIESGVGNSVDPDPRISMDRSKNGQTFTQKRTRRMGKVGEYDHRVIWNKNGRAARFEIFRFTVSDKVKKVMIKLEADVL